MCSKLQESDFVCSHRPLTKEGVLEMAHEYALKRMEHCEQLLLQHLEEGDAKAVSDGQIIVWPQGHFSFPVYEALEEFVNGKRDFFKDPLLGQQVAKQIAFEGIYGGKYDYEQLYVFNVAMEVCLVANKTNFEFK
jgi:hypothetical protein